MKWSWNQPSVAQSWKRLWGKEYKKSFLGEENVFPLDVGWWCAAQIFTNTSFIWLSLMGNFLVYKYTSINPLRNGMLICEKKLHCVQRRFRKPAIASICKVCRTCDQTASCDFFIPWSLIMNWKEMGNLEVQTAIILQYHDVHYDATTNLCD